MHFSNMHNEPLRCCRSSLILTFFAHKNNVSILIQSSRLFPKLEKSPFCEDYICIMERRMHLYILKALETACHFYLFMKPLFNQEVPRDKISLPRETWPSQHTSSSSSKDKTTTNRKYNHEIHERKRPDRVKQLQFGFKLFRDVPDVVCSADCSGSKRET